MVAEARAALQEQVLDQGRKLYEERGGPATVEWVAAIDSAPTLKEPALVAKGRMYSGAGSRMAIQDYGKADQQFDRLLRADMKFQPDALAFPASSTS